MDERRAFFKGFLLATGLAVIFVAGRVSASPGTETVDDMTRAVDKLTSEVSDMGDDLRQIRRDGLTVEQKFGSEWKVSSK
jgi:outer membrane murein-binding lipoprotein Lpp